MSSPITQCQLDILSMLRGINDLPLDEGLGAFKYVNIWDDQIDNMLADKEPNYSFAMPAAFLELDPGKCETLGFGVTSYPETMIRLHLCCMQLDGGNDTMEQNLTIFDIRDKVKAAMQLSGASWMSDLQCIEDKLDYKHGNTYKYRLAFVTNLIDTKGSLYDADSGAITYTMPNPIDNIIIDETIEKYGTDS